MSDTNDNNKGYGVSPFQRNNYFYGKLMAVRDFKDEQDYMNKKRHLLNRMVNGFGIVCGLEDVDYVEDVKYVKDVKDVYIYPADGNIKIKFNSGGMAIDRQGREIVIPDGLEKDVLDSSGTQLTVSSMGEHTYLYMEYLERKGEMVIDVSGDTGTQESCSYNRVIEDFQVVASTEEPKIPTVSCPPPYSDDMAAEIDKQQVKEWMQKETSKLCSDPEEDRVFILALKQIGGGVEIDTGKTEEYLSFVANNRVLSELLACHLADFTNPHGTTAEQLDALQSINGVRRDGNGNVKLVKKENSSITIMPHKDENMIVIGEKHSRETGNPHETKHSDIVDVLAVDPETPGSERVKHVSNDDAAKWNKAAEEPVGLKSIDNVENPGGNIDLAARNAIEIFPDNVKNLITISETHSGQTDNPHKVGMSNLIDLNAGNRKITRLAEPERGKDAANKRYVDEKTGATVGSDSDIENVTTRYARQLNVSDNSTARGERSQVNASVGSTAGGHRSQVNASWSSEANHDNSQVNASWGVASGSAFTVCGGFGMEGGPSPNNRKWELNSKNGDITHAGSINSHASFSDYGEYFENLKKGEIDMGVLIALEGANVRPAKKGEDFIGVVSGTAAIRLGDSPFGWQGRFLKDEWGRPVYEEIKDPAWQPKTVPDEKWKPKKGQTEAHRPMKAVETEKDRPTIRVQKENPDYDPGRESAPRSQRPREWTLVGLLGQVYVRCDDTVKPGDFVKSVGKGIGTMSEEKTKLRAMKVTKEFDGKYAIVYCLLK